MRSHLRILPILGLLLGSMAARAQETAVPAPSFTQEQKTSVLKAIQSTLVNRAFVPGIDFKKWDEFLEKKKEVLDEAKDVNDFTRVVNQALRDFGISHCRLQTPRAAASRGKTTAVGPGVQVTPEETGLRVRRVFDQSDAKAQGLEEKDLILKVNGEKATKPENLVGEAGQKISLEIQKADGTTKTVELTFKEYSIVRKETLEWANEDTAVIRIPTFSAGYDRANIEKLVGEANVKAKNLVLDLRSNGGGAVNNLNHLLSLLMPEGTTYGTYVSRRLADNYAKEMPDKPVTAEAIASWAPNKAKTRKLTTDPFKGKIAVLINRGSASASEIVAAALQENVNAKLVGGKSAGAVLSSVFIPLVEGFSIQIPVSDYITVKGRRLEANPLEPDAASAAIRKEGESDPAVVKAIELLRQSIG